MTDKIADFRRINEPRVDRALAQIGHIETSAASMRIDPAEFQQLIEPIRYKVRGPAIEERRPMGGNFEEPFAKPVVDLTPRTHDLRKMLEMMDTKALVDLLTMTAAQIDIRLND